MAPHIHALDHLVLTVADIAITCRFYAQALGMEVITFQPDVGEKRHALRFGTQKINLHQAGREFQPKARTPTPGSADLCFVSEVSLREWQNHLTTQNVTIEEGPVARSGATGPLVSLYIRDPDGNLIEISNRA